MKKHKRLLLSIVAVLSGGFLAVTILNPSTLDKEFDIPAASWEPVFFEKIDRVSKMAKWTPLRETDVPAGSLEVRVWIISSFGSQGLRMYRKGNEWTGYRVDDLYDSVEINMLTPKTSWTSIWERLQALEIMTLPDSSTLPDEIGIRDGVGYVVEISDLKHYRTYMYGNPRHQTWSEAKQIMEIMRILQDEFRDSLPPTVSWGN